MTITTVSASSWWNEFALSGGLIFNRSSWSRKDNEGMIRAFPFDREGATCGVNFDDAVAIVADVARMLGISTARVAQMCESGKLTSWKDGSKRLILRDSVNARLAEKPKAGRPKKAAVA